MKKTHTKKRIWSIFLAFTLLLTMFPLSAAADEPATSEPLEADVLILDIADGDISVTESGVTQAGGAAQAIPAGGLVITGTSDTHSITISSDATVTAKDLTLSNASETDRSLINVENGTVTLFLEGTNQLTNPAVGDGNKAALHVAADAALTIGGTGSLSIFNGQEDGEHEAHGAAIGGDFEEAPGAVTISGGSITILQYGTSAGIGGGARADSGKLSITGGNIDVDVLPAGGNIESAGTGIGGGGENVKDSSLIGSGGSADISITGGTVDAYVKSSVFDFGSVSSGAAIGAGENKGGTIYIGGDAQVTAKANNDASAIGSSNATWSSAGDTVHPSPDDPMNITIEGNAVVSAQTESLDFYGQGAYAGAAIGMATQNLQPCTITIGGSADVTARGSWYGAGIGGGYVQINEQAQPLTITIKDSARVDASAEVYGAGIGSGYGDAGAESADITIEGNPTVIANGGWGGAGIGCAKGTLGGSITITGGNITAYGGTGGVDLFGIAIGGAGIGAGAVDDSDGCGAVCGPIEISGDANIKAYGSVGSAGIGGGNIKAVTTTGTPTIGKNSSENAGGAERITISGSASVYAVGGAGASAIGAGCAYEGELPAEQAPVVKEMTITEGTRIEAYADGAKFAVDTAVSDGGSQISDGILNARFAEDANPAGQEKSIRTLVNGTEDTALTLPENYRSFAATVADTENGAPQPVQVQDAEDGRESYIAYYDGQIQNQVFSVPSDGMLTEDELRWTTPVVIRPADITVYMGGDGYEGVVGDSGEPGESNGLPEAGFWFTIPDTINGALGGHAQADDLSKYLTFTYDDGNGTTRTWTVEPYGSADASTSEEDGIQRFIYRMVPAADQDPIRLQFTDEDGNTIVSDQFDVSLSEQNKTYDMTIYANTLDQSLITANFKNIPGLADSSFPIQITPGKLTIRGATEAEQTAPVLDAESAVSGDVIAAVAPEDVTYYVNDSHVEVEKEHVHLLRDEVLDTEVLTEHIESVIQGAEDGIPTGDYLYQFQYLDLVDKTNGNAYVTLGAGQEMTLYWPLPEDANASGPFYIAHFDALDRNYAGSVEDQLKDHPAKVLPAALATVNGQQYVKFSTGSFSPFALVYQKQSSGGGGGTTYYTLTYESNGGTAYAKERYSSGTTVQLTKSPVREGYTFTGWYADKALTKPITSIKMTSSKTVYAGWEATETPDWLNGSDHFAYVIGYDDGTVRPTANITRSEVAAIFFRLLQDNVRDKYLTDRNTFTDVTDEMWHNTAISTLTAMGILEGRSAASFDPDAPITRAEFAAVCARFEADAGTAGASFPDIEGHWAEDEIWKAASLGWILGRSDGTFGPDLLITRAEAMTMINRVLGRLPETADDLLDGMTVWPDNRPGDWYYLAVQEATNSHDYESKGERYEHWTKLTEDPNWTQYQ